MNVYVAFGLLFIVAILQSTAIPQLTILGVHPDLMLMVVTSWSILSGAEEGMLWALLGGIPLDLFSGAPFGVHTLALLLVGFLASLGERAVFRADLLMPIVVIPLATLAYELTLLGGLYLDRWPVRFGAHMTQIVLPCMLVNTLCMAAVYLVLRTLYRRVHKGEITL